MKPSPWKYTAVLKIKTCNSQNGLIWVVKSRRIYVGRFDWQPWLAASATNLGSRNGNPGYHCHVHCHPQ